MGLGSWVALAGYASGTARHEVDGVVGVMRRLRADERSTKALTNSEDGVSSVDPLARTFQSVLVRRVHAVV